MNRNRAVYPFAPTGLQPEKIRAIEPVENKKHEQEFKHDTRTDKGLDRFERKHKLTPIFEI